MSLQWWWQRCSCGRCEPTPWHVLSLTTGVCAEWEQSSHPGPMQLTGTPAEAPPDPALACPTCSYVQTTVTKWIDERHTEHVIECSHKYGTVTGEQLPDDGERGETPEA
jgi:hypothetical protein